MTVVPAATLLAGCTPAEKEPDRLVNTELGQWRFWGRRDENGTLDYSTGEYTFEFPKRSLLVPRTYPISIRVSFEKYYSLIEIVRVSKAEMYLVGVMVPHDTSKEFTNQWSYWDKNPDYTVVHRVRATWIDNVYDKVYWNGTKISDRKL